MPDIYHGYINCYFKGEFNVPDSMNLREGRYMANLGVDHGKLHPLRVQMGANFVNSLFKILLEHHEYDIKDVLADLNKKTTDVKKLQEDKKNINDTVVYRTMSKDMPYSSFEGLGIDLSSSN